MIEYCQRPHNTDKVLGYRWQDGYVYEVYECGCTGWHSQHMADHKKEADKVVKKEAV